jgi:hypothetical protein
VAGPPAAPKEYDMPSTPSDRPADTVSQDDIRVAGELALERYTAARRHYTSLHVEFTSLEQPDSDLADSLEAARTLSLELAAALRKVEDGDPEAVLQELEAGQVSESERARTTNRFSIAELNRAAAPTPASWDWQR